MEIKSFKQPGVISWSDSKNHNQLLVSANLQPCNEIYDLNLLSIDVSERKQNINLIGNAQSNTAFRCLSWGQFGEKQNSYPYGVVFGGMQDGSFSLWNPEEMIKSYKNTKIYTNQDHPALLFAEQPEEDAFPIMCAEWNSLKNNFLAFGSTNVLILDINEDISNPEIMKPGKKNPHQGSYITSVAWNKEVSHILASASQNGLIVLWDIKADKSIFQFRDSSSSAQSRNVVICWSKNISTQIAVALDDGKKNELQIWDLRNQKGPIIVIDKGHNKGIHSMDWCEMDSQLILSASRDNKICCWNYTQEEEPISTIQLQSNIHDVKWSKRLPSIFSVTSEDKISIYTLNDNNLFNYVPKWYKLPAGSTILANDTILVYSQSNQNKLQQYSFNFDNKSRVVLKNQLSDMVNILKGQQCRIEEDQWFHALIEAKKSQDCDVSIYEYLGFNKKKIVKQVQKYTGKKRQTHPTAPHENQKNQNKTKTKAYTNMLGQQAASFFQTIGNSEHLHSSTKFDEEEDNDNIKYDMVLKNSNWDIGKQKIIKDNILIGNYEGAIDAALKCGRTAQALIIAYSLDTNTFNMTLKTFFTETTDSFITDILKHITNKDTEQLVRKYDLGKWKECVALIFSISSNEKRVQLLNLLATRLQQRNKAQNSQQVPFEGDNSIIICYILAENFVKISQHYYDGLFKHAKNSYDRKCSVVKYGKRLVQIVQSLTTSVHHNLYFLRMMKQISYIAIEMNQNLLAFQILSRYLPEKAAKELDYIIYNTKELEQYRDKNRFKQFIPPQMEKQKKKVVKVKGTQPIQKLKNKMHKPIFEMKQENTRTAPPPPPINKRGQVHQSQINNPFNEGNTKQVHPSSIPPSNIPPSNKSSAQSIVPPPPIRKKVAEINTRDDDKEHSSKVNQPYMPQKQKNRSLKGSSRQEQYSNQTQQTVNRVKPPPPPMQKKVKKPVLSTKKIEEDSQIKSSQKLSNQSKGQRKPVQVLGSSTRKIKQEKVKKIEETEKVKIPKKPQRYIKRQQQQDQDSLDSEELDDDQNNQSKSQLIIQKPPPPAQHRKIPPPPLPKR